MANHNALDTYLTGAAEQGNLSASQILQNGKEDSR